MTESEKKVLFQNIESDVIEWEYAPSPTPYDLVRDSSLIRLLRLVTHSMLHFFIYHYNGLKVINNVNVLDNSPCIIAPNHSSHLDTLAVISSLPNSYINHTFAMAAKNYFFRNSFITFWARLIVNVIPMDRSGTEKRGLVMSLQKQQEGQNILIFPEGTRTTTSSMGQFKKGVILLSRKAKTPIIPTYIQGTFSSMPKGTLFPKRSKITVVFGKPVRYWDAKYSSMKDSEATQDLEGRVKSLKQELEYSIR